MYRDNNSHHEPSEEEWEEIERMIEQEEIKEERLAQEMDKKELENFKRWCKRNGIKW